MISIFLMQELSSSSALNAKPQQPCVIPESVYNSSSKSSVVSLDISDSASTSLKDSSRGISPAGDQTFVLPSTWRPAVMYFIKGKDEAEQRKRLTPDIRNASVRDIVSTMYAHMNHPNKDFCTKVAKQFAKMFKGKAAKYSTEVLERKFSSKATPLLNQYVVVYIKP